MSEDNIKRIDIKEFRDLGYLQELNRSFLHPLGMALEIKINEDGTEILGGIWDYREDPEGMHYGETWGSEPGTTVKAKYVRDQFEKKAFSRQDILGYVIQPVKGIHESD